MPRLPVADDDVADAPERRNIMFIARMPASAIDIADLHALTIPFAGISLPVMKEARKIRSAASRSARTR